MSRGRDTHGFHAQAQLSRSRFRAFFSKEFENVRSVLAAHGDAPLLAWNYVELEQAVHRVSLRAERLVAGVPVDREAIARVGLTS